MRIQQLRADTLAGITTAFALAPECIAFALVAHLHPLMGLYGAFIICTLTALLGGRPGMVSGAAGSMAVVIIALVVQHGVQYLLATVLLSGLLMAVFGLLKLGKLVRMVPHPVCWASSTAWPLSLPWRSWNTSSTTAPGSLARRCTGWPHWWP